MKVKVTNFIKTFCISTFFAASLYCAENIKKEIDKKDTAASTPKTNPPTPEGTTSLANANASATAHPLTTTNPAPLAKAEQEKKEAEEKKIKEEKASAEKVELDKEKAEKEKLEKEEKTKLEKVAEEKIKVEAEAKTKSEIEEKIKAEKETVEKLKEIKEEQEKKIKEKNEAEKNLKAKLEKAKKELTPSEKKEQALISTLDTQGIEDEGNWLLKRVWWEQAEITFEKIIDMNAKIVQVQSDYFDKSKGIEKQLANNFRQLGYEQGELNDVLSGLIDEMKKEREVAGDLTIEERQFLDLLNEKKNDFEKLKKDLDELEKQNVLMEDSLSEIVNQIKKSHDYEKKSWDNFKQIGRVLNDKKAKELFYQMDADLKNVQNILDYMKKSLNNFFNSLLQKAKTLSSSIGSQVEELLNEGINLKEKLEQLKKIDQEREEQRKKNKLEQLQKEHRPRVKIKKGWVETIADWVLAPFCWIKSFFY